MRCVLSCTLLGLALVLGGALAAPPDVREPAGDKEKEKPAQGTVADVTMGDGSTVRVTLVSESVELETKYGKLKIPAADVRRIEFAYRAGRGGEEGGGGGEALGSVEFEKREAASKELREIGLHAYPALEEAAKSPDAEVAKRGAALLGEIREKVPADDLTFPKKDRLVTAEFTVTGLITSPTLRAKTSYFGEADLKLADLRVFQAAGAGNDRKLTVDAAKFGSAPNQWMETATVLERGESLHLTASGQVDLWPQEPGQYMTSAKGVGNVRPPAFSAGTLMGKVGENGAPFPVGEKYDGKAGASGKLYLHIIPSHWGGPSAGSYEVKVSAGERERAGLPFRVARPEMRRHPRSRERETASDRPITSSIPARPRSSPP